MADKYTAIYVRVSSGGQNLKSQMPDLERWAASQDARVKWYTDKFTGTTMNRPGWNKLEADYRAGKVSKIVCWRLDRLGRTARELLALRDELRERRVDLVCVMSGVMGLQTPEGRMMFGVIAQFAEFETEVRKERQRAGIDVALANVKAGKRKGWGGSKAGVRKKVKPTQVKMIRQMKRQGEPISQIATAVGLSRPTIYDVLAN